MAPTPGKLFRNKTPIRVLMCVCSWDDMTANDIAEELHTQKSNVWRAITLLRQYGLVEHNRPSRWHEIIRPTAEGRRAMREHVADNDTATV